MSKERNTRLTSARLALPPGVNTQQAVADAIAELVHAETGTRPPLDADYISKLERGEITWPSAIYRTAFRRHFGVSTDTELGFHSRRTTAAATATVAADNHARPFDDRQVDQQLVPLASQAAFGGLHPQAAGLLTGMTPAPALPARIGAQDIAFIEQTTDLFEQWDFAFGGGLSLNAVIGQLDWVRTLNQRTSTTPKSREYLQAATARLAQVAGWMAFDAGDIPTARRCWLFGLDMAAAAGSWPLRVNILTDMAREAVYTDHPRRCLDLMLLASTAVSELTATLRTAIHVVTARGHGALGNAQDCLRHIGQAEETFAHRDTSADPAWIWYYDEAQLAGDSGHALFDLAVHGEYTDRAVDRLTTACDLHGAQAARSLAFAQTKLAILHAQREDLDAATSHTSPALAAAPSIRSHRLTTDLRHLTRTLRTARHPDATALRAEVRGVLSTLS